VDEKLGGSHRVDAVRAHLHEMAGDVTAAAEHYRRAAARTASIPEQEYLQAKAASLQQSGA
jgi:predicted RNA polymerase sigma factor